MTEATLEAPTVSAWISPGYMRLSAVAKSDGTIARFITVNPGGQRSCAITSFRYPFGTHPLHAACDALLCHGTMIVEHAHQELHTVFMRWRDGRPGMRPRSAAAHRVMVQAAGRVTSLAIDLARAYQDLRALDYPDRHESGVPDWLDAALEDVARGSSSEKAAKSLVRHLTRH